MDALLKMSVMLFALLVASYIVLEGRLPFWAAGNSVVSLGRCQLALSLYPYRSRRTYWRLEVSRRV